MMHGTSKVGKGLNLHEHETNTLYHRFLVNFFKQNLTNSEEYFLSPPKKKIETIIYNLKIIKEHHLLFVFHERCANKLPIVYYIRHDCSLQLLVLR